MTEQELENVYREYLEQDIIFCLAERRKIPYEKAMALYYGSRLAEHIYHGTEGIQYLDYSILADMVEQEEENGL